MSSDRYILTTHAITRFVERVRPALRWSAAEEELSRLLALGEAVEQPPPWFVDRAQQQAARYVVIANEIVVPLSASREQPGRWLALTCIARGGISDVARARRNDIRSRRTEARAATRRGGRTQASSSDGRDHKRDRRTWTTRERFKHAA